MLIVERARMSERFRPPQHLYTHEEGTFLDAVPEDVDRAAKTQALQQPHLVLVPYAEGLQPLEPVFRREGMQWHDVATI